MNDTTKEAYEKSILLLDSLVTKKGFIASTKQVSNYRRVWVRDGVAAGLAALTTDNKGFFILSHTS